MIKSKKWLCRQRLFWWRQNCLPEFLPFVCFILFFKNLTFRNKFWKFRNRPSFLDVSLFILHIYSDHTRNLEHNDRSIHCRTEIMAARRERSCCSSAGLIDWLINNPMQAWVTSLSTGDKTALIDLHPSIWRTTPRMDVLHQNIRWQNEYRKMIYTRSLTRGELPGVNTKPWPQTKSGRFY